MGSIFGHRIDFYWGGGSERPAAHTKQKLTQVTPGLATRKIWKLHCKFDVSKKEFYLPLCLLSLRFNPANRVLKRIRLEALQNPNRTTPFRPLSISVTALLRTPKKHWCVSFSVAVLPELFWLLLKIPYRSPTHKKRENEREKKLKERKRALFRVDVSHFFVAPSHRLEKAIKLLKLEPFMKFF